MAARYGLRELLDCRSHPFTDFRTNGHGNQHFDQVSRNKREHAYGKRGRYRVSGLHTEPGSSEGIADGGSHDHAKKLDPAFLAVVNHDTGNDCHWDKAYNITAGGAGQFGNSAGKAGEDRKACEADQQIEEIAERACVSSPADRGTGKWQGW